MAHRTPLAPPVLRFLTFVLILGCVLLSSPAQLWAKGCAESLGPAQPPPPSLWDDLQPEAILVDATRWTGSQLPNTAYPISTSVDIENGWVFQSFYGGFSIWDARTNPAVPTRASVIGGWERNFPSWPTLTEFTQIVFYMDVPEGNDNLAAVSAITPVGLTIWDTTNKTAPRALYQDTGKFSYQVYAARIGNRDYAFAADFLADPGLHVYDMTAAKSFTNPCIENHATGQGNCPNVYKTRVGTRENTKYVHGLGVGNRHFVAKSGGSITGSGVKIYEVTNPAQPQLVVQDFVGFAQFGDIHGLAMWTNNGQHYLTVRHTMNSLDTAKIFNVTSCLTTGCAGLQNLEVWRSPESLKPYPQSDYWLSATFSRSGTTPFIYYGNHDPCRDGEAPFQTEYLYDVSNPSVPDEISPQHHIVDPPPPAQNGKQVDYWSWYYSDTVRGWSHFGPRVAKFHGAYLYRAAATIFDIHKWTGSSTSGPPVADFEWSPDTIYAGDPVDFTSTSNGLPTGFDWTFPGGSPPSSSTANVEDVTFSSPGTKAVTLTVTKGVETSTKTRDVIVLDPAPAVDGITVSPQNPLACQPVTLTAAGLRGKPPLGVNWTVSNGPLVVVNNQPGNPSYIWSSAGSPPGTYTADVTVSKAGFPSDSASTQVVLAPLPALPNAGSFTPANDPFSLGSVRFHANVAGATEWRWNFGDGWGPWTSNPSDQANGPDPLHSFTSTGTKTVRVAVRNCVNLGPNGEGFESAPLTVNITSVEPLRVSLFLAVGCEGPFCDFSPSQTITFRVELEGSPTGVQYEYDWLGNGFGGANGADDQTSSTVVTTHSYAAQGTFSPMVRLRRGPDLSPEVIHRAITIRPGGGTNPPPPPPPPGPSVTVSGPTSGQLNTAYNYTAAGSNCTPGTWTWTGGTGATVTGSGSTVSITWSSAGSKSVQATTSGCGTGTRTVNIAAPNSGGLTANFTFSPANPQLNQAVTFDGSSSTGSPSQYFWEFPGGATASGVTASRTFTTAGSHVVKLTVYKDCVGLVCANEISTTKTVNVTGGPPPVVASFDTSATCTSDITGVRCEAQTGQAVTFTSTSTGNPTTLTWSFNDGTPAGSGSPVSHTWGLPGTYLVQLTAANGQGSNATSRVFIVSGPPQFSASFTSANCAGAQCTAQTGQAVSFTSTSAGAVSHSWSFGDGTPAVTGSPVSHTWNSPGNYTVQLTAGNGSATATTSRTFVVTGAPIAQTRSVVLPWIAQTRGALVQSSDLYVHNPGTTAMDVTLEFRKRGVPESSPPRMPRTIQPGATLYVGDVLRDLFNREGVAGFIVVTVDRGDAEPVITSFNTTFQADGKQFGQTVSGVSMSSAGSGSGSGPEDRMQHLVGLIDNTERLAYFGLSNPTDQPATYRLRFFDKTGHQISESQDLLLSRFGQRQYQVREIEELFGISNVADYRVEIENKTGGMIVPYASNLRLSSEDPSFIEPGSSKYSKSYLLGTLSAPGLNNSTWQTDLLLSNINTQAVTADVTFTSVGLTSVPTTPVRVTLQPGQTERLENVIAGRWNIRNAVGVLTVSSTSPNGIFPIAQGESYESTNTDPAKRFGQSMTALSDADAAGAGHSQYLVGMRQDAKNRTTIWIFNPDSVTAEYDILYRPLGGGAPLGTVPGVRLGAGKMRQFSPSQHPIPAAGVANGFTVEIVVKSGKVLSSAQVINNLTNDPAYIQGEAR
jgi:PKD repeat protein